MTSLRDTAPALYFPEDDRNLHVQRQIWLGGVCLNLEAATSAGRRLAEQVQKPNEDAFSVIDSYDGTLVAAVFDGASSQKPIKGLNGTSGARYASHALSEMMSSLPGGLEPREMLEKIDGWLGENLKQIDGVDRDDPNTLPTSTATILQVDPAKERLLTAHVGDTFALTRGRDSLAEIITDNLHREPDEEILKHLEELAAEYQTTPREIKTGEGYREQSAIIKQEIMNMFAVHRNRPDGTGEGIVNGDPEMYQYIDARVLDLSRMNAALIGSDGLVPPHMHESDPADRQMIMEMALRSGVRGLIRYTRWTEDRDPYWRHVRHKHADDATGILLVRD